VHYLIEVAAINFKINLEGLGTLHLTRQPMQKLEQLVNFEPKLTLLNAAALATQGLVSSIDESEAS